MEKNKRLDWETDFREFLEMEEVAVPQALSARVADPILRKLNPSFWQVFLKLILIQAVAGGVSLLYCPQFGVSFTSSHGLMHYLMQYGETVCMVGCGALFTGASLLVASFALRPEEVRVFREHRLLQMTSIAALSIGAFFCVGGTIVGGLALVWALGAIVGGMVTLELGWSIRRLTYGRPGV